MRDPNLTDSEGQRSDIANGAPIGSTLSPGRADISAMNTRTSPNKLRPERIVTLLRNLLWCFGKPTTFCNKPCSDQARNYGCSLEFFGSTLPSDRNQLYLHVTHRPLTIGHDCGSAPSQCWRRRSHSCASRQFLTFR